jgi:hypothetical protein
MHHLPHHILVCTVDDMKRMSVTLSDRVERTVDELGLEGRLRQAIEDWYLQRGEDVDLGSESARLRALLDVADVTVREWALEIGYRHMATWHNDQTAAERPVWRGRRIRAAATWAAEEHVQ